MVQKKKALSINESLTFINLTYESKTSCFCLRFHDQSLAWHFKSHTALCWPWGHIQLDNAWQTAQM